ncbi:uncharacterized protein Z519_10299 [Cladophialophora bantiana CBS 173.52]|uniref:Aldehyde dehydrogenase domain-containing protein n=1 Tax=Cladophialophora bantiana (strain ATCC 10958 / CBS 173.52 / CDC B-1940 / NIH 8579) TaxID=1442370 RepID=A0A0D2HD55_CLAB1|nr:uncharacterized protein Z519_10299 [Cladophialophora bantiana CBS 173.52]KIW88815.1 hypothetical protein Z519_10299 [Cladophialophora bantiana CBS 173.52]
MNTLATVKAAAVDGRLSNPWWRQSQLQSLHHGLVQASDVLINAILQDSNFITPPEAHVELHLAIKTVEHHYTALKPESEVEDEYRILQRDTPDRREAFGIAVIVPTSHTYLFSVVSAVSAALAAGNCIVLKTENHLSRLPHLLQQILRQSLDGDIFAAAVKIPEEATHSSHRWLQVLQNGLGSGSTSAKAAITPSPNGNALISPVQSRVVAVVDRTADTGQAAKALVTARFAFGGSSPYAPDLVLVNEFVKTKFVEAVEREAAHYLNAGGNSEKTVDSGTSVEHQHDPGDVFRQTMVKLERDSNAQILTSGPRGAVLEVNSRQSALFRRRLDDRVLVVHDISSLDDAIDSINISDSDDVAALYAFADVSSAKYLCQFIRTSAAFVNHIPIELLVGPATPLNHPMLVSLRYTTEFFSVPRPQYISPPADSARLLRIIERNTEDKQDLLATLSTGSKAASHSPNRSPGGGLGFFEQGIVIGLVLFFSPVLVGLIYLGVSKTSTALRSLPHLF